MATIHRIGKASRKPGNSQGLWFSWQLYVLIRFSLIFIWEKQILIWVLLLSEKNSYILMTTMILWLHPFVGSLQNRMKIFIHMFSYPICFGFYNWLVKSAVSYMYIYGVREDYSCPLLGMPLRLVVLSVLKHSTNYYRRKLGFKEVLVSVFIN